MSMAARTGRLVSKDGKIVNFADIIGGTDTGRTADVRKYMPMSGLAIREDGHIIDVAAGLEAFFNGGGGSSADLKPLNITIGEETFSYTGKNQVDITIAAAEGVTF